MPFDPSASPVPVPHPPVAQPDNPLPDRYPLRPREHGHRRRQRHRRRSSFDEPIVYERDYDDLDEGTYTRECGNEPKSRRFFDYDNNGLRVEWCPYEFTKVDPNTHLTDCCDTRDKTSGSLMLLNAALC